MFTDTMHKQHNINLKHKSSKEYYCKEMSM